MMRQINQSVKNAAFPVAFLLLAVLIAGCSDQERRGVSPLPQNRPAGWETNPYGSSMRN